MRHYASPMAGCDSMGNDVARDPRENAAKTPQHGSRRRCKGHVDDLGAVVGGRTIEALVRHGKAERADAKPMPFWGGQGKVAFRGEVLTPLRNAGRTFFLTDGLSVVEFVRCVWTSLPICSTEKQNFTLPSHRQAW